MDFLSALACNSFLAIQRENLQTSMEIVTSTYSSDLRNFIMYLLTNPTRIKSVNDLMPMIGNVKNRLEFAGKSGLNVLFESSVLIVNRLAFERTPKMSIANLTYSTVLRHSFIEVEFISVFIPN